MANATLKQPQQWPIRKHHPLDYRLFGIHAKIMAARELFKSLDGVDLDDIKEVGLIFCFDELLDEVQHLAELALDNCYIEGPNMANIAGAGAPKPAQW